MASDYQLIHYWPPRWFQNWQDDRFQVSKNSLMIKLWSTLKIDLCYALIHNRSNSLFTIYSNRFKWIITMFWSFASGISNGFFFKMYCIVIDLWALYWRTRVKFYSRWVIKFSSYWKKPIHYKIHLRRQMKKGIQIENFIHTENNEKIQKI